MAEAKEGICISGLLGERFEIYERQGVVLIFSTARQYSFIRLSPTL